MNTRLITNYEIAQRQQEVRHVAHQARHTLTIAGIRQLFGNTLIAIGTGIHGRLEQRREPVTAPPASIARGI